MFKKRTFLLGFQWYSKYFKSNDKLLTFCTVEYTLIAFIH